MDRVEWGSKAGRPHVVEVSVPSETKPGLYTCGAMNLHVVDRVLPPSREWWYFLDLWQHPWAVARYFNVKPFSKEHYAAMRPVYETLATAGQKTLTIKLVDRPWNHQCYDAYSSMIGRRKGADGKWSFDYSIFDQYVKFGRSCGLGPDIACYSMCPWGYMVDWKEWKAESEESKTGEWVERREKLPPGTPEFEDYWGPFLVDFSNHLKEMGWFNDVYIAMDERSLEDVKTIGDFIRSQVPEMKIAMAGNSLPSKYGTKIDNFCMILGAGITDEYLAEAVARRKKGMKTTYYVCCGPPYPNTFMRSGPGEAFWLGVYPAMCGLDGFLRWAWNSWPQDPVVDADCQPWTAGDAFLVYPDGSPSWRFLELRNGIVAAEKVRILKEQGLFADDLAALAAKFKPVEASQGKCDFPAMRREVLSIVNKRQ